MRTRLSLLLALALATLIFAVPGCGSSNAEQAQTRSRQIPPPPFRIAMIILENRGFNDVIGNPAAPYLNGLAKRGTLATRYYGVGHPSLPNYLALIGGSTFGIDDDCTDCAAYGNNLALQLSRAKISWRAYMEDMPGPCFGDTEADGYRKRHNPFMYFPTIAEAPKRCANVVPADRLDEDLHNDALPAFSWLTPNLCHDSHDCSVRVMDRWLSRLGPRVMRHLGRNGTLIVTFDEGEDQGPRGGRLVTLLAGPAVRRGIRLRRPLDHYSMLATIEDRFGLPRIRKARGAATLSRAFKVGNSAQR